MVGRRMNDLDCGEEPDGDAVELSEEHCVVAAGEEPLRPLPARCLVEEVRSPNDRTRRLMAQVS